jgi:hypothetical protein
MLTVLKIKLCKPTKPYEMHSHKNSQSRNLRCAVCLLKINVGYTLTLWSTWQRCRVTAGLVPHQNGLLAV